MAARDEVDVTKNLADEFNIPQDDIVNAYLFGSWLYGTASETSDKDYVLVLNSIPQHTNQSEVPEPKTQGYKVLTKSITSSLGNDAIVMTPDEFQSSLNLHWPTSVECYFAPAEFTLVQNRQFQFRLELTQLRSAFSTISEYSWNRARKKLIVDKDFNFPKAQRALFHAFRTFVYGVQLAETGKITDFTAANDFWQSIEQQTSTDWKGVWRPTYQPKYRELRIQFKKCAPKALRKGLDDDVE